MFLLVHAQEYKKIFCLCACTRFAKKKKRICIVCLRVQLFVFTCACVFLAGCSHSRFQTPALSASEEAWPMLKASSVMSTARLNVYTSIMELLGTDAPPIPHSSP